MTSLVSITVFCGSDNPQQNILHIQFECGEYFVKYYQPHITQSVMDLNNVMMVAT